MSEPFLAEIRIMSFGFPPKGWARCDGQVLPINQNQALFALLGTTYGGNGRTTFALPDLRSRTPIHVGADSTLGEQGGSESHALAVGELPTHSHALMASSAKAMTPLAYSSNQGNVLAESSRPMYGAPGNLTPAADASVTATGAGQPHPNVQPSLALNFCIALQGIFPSHN